MLAKLLAVSVVAVVTMTVACTPQPAGGNRPQGTADLSVDCQSSGVLTVSANPWRVALPNRGGQITWNITASSNVAEATVDSVPGFAWPFDSRGFKAKKNAPAHGHGVKNGLAAGTYKYTITAICNLGNGVDTVSIDPDMIIPN